MRKTWHCVLPAKSQKMKSPAKNARQGGRGRNRDWGRRGKLHRRVPRRSHRLPVLPPVLGGGGTPSGSGTRGSWRERSVAPASERGCFEIRARVADWAGPGRGLGRMWCPNGVAWPGMDPIRHGHLACYLDGLGWLMG